MKAKCKYIKKRINKMTKAQNNNILSKIQMKA